jgi:hypothetical protein
VITEGLQAGVARLVDPVAAAVRNGLVTDDGERK